MIHLICSANRHLYTGELLDNHRERHRQFVIERGWGLRTIDGGEYDDYDDEHALHLVGFSSQGEVEVGCRLRPTASGGVLPDLFPHLVDKSEGPIVRPGTFECTRYFTAAQNRGTRGFEARSKLHISMLELMQDLGGDRLLGFVDLGLLTHLRRFSGLQIRPVGLPTAYEDGGTAIAFEIGVTPADVETARTRLAIPTRQLFIAPSWLPAKADVLSLAQTTKVLLSAPERRRRQLQRLARIAARDIVFQPDVERLKAAMAG